MKKQLFLGLVLALAPLAQATPSTYTAPAVAALSGLALATGFSYLEKFQNKIEKILNKTERPAAPSYGLENLGWGVGSAVIAAFLHEKAAAVNPFSSFCITFGVAYGLTQKKALTESVNTQLIKLLNASSFGPSLIRNGSAYPQVQAVIRTNF